MSTLSIIIPSRNEMFLARTIQDILENIEADTEIIATLDGAWARPPVPQHDRVNIIYVPEAIGQRAATNIAAKLAQGKYVMKVDAHCSFEKGFDRKMIEGFKEVGDDVTMVPIMRNLWAFSWKCYLCGWTKYQGPRPKVCEQCGKSGKVRMKMMWIGKRNPQSISYCFDSVPHFQYFNAYKVTDAFKEQRKTNFTETMSLQGSCFMSTLEKYLELNLCDESLGNWGNQGIEVALKTRLSGGRVLVNHNTWYAHMFRTQGGDFGFPYDLSGRGVQQTKNRVKALFFGNSWDKQIYPLSKVIEQFWPIPGWSEEAFKSLKKDEMQVKRPGVYSIKNKDNTKAYIGSSINIAQRFGEHLRELRRNEHGNEYLQHAWNKYGEDYFSFNIEYFCSQDTLLIKEQEILDLFTSDFGWRNIYNLNPTASLSGRNHTEETKAKIGEKSKGRRTFLGKKHSSESIEKIRLSKLGKDPWNKGIQHSETTKRKISESKLKNPIEVWNKGKKGLYCASEETRKKLSDSLKGRIPWNKGKHHTDETKQKIKEAAKKHHRHKDEKGRFVKK